MERIVLFPRPAVLERIGRGAHAVIEASAGTGKTYTLEHLFVELLLTGAARPEQILVVTFTEKATAELRERLRAKLRQLCAACERGVPAASGQTLDTPLAGEPGAAAWRLGASEQALLQAALVGFERVTISTIHAFCQRLLAEHAFATGRLFDEARVEERRAFGLAFRRVLRRTLASIEPYRGALAAHLAQSDLAGLEDLLYRCHATRAELLVPVREGREVSPRQAAAMLFLPLVQAELETYKREAGLYDFGDMLTLVHRALLGPRPGPLAEGMRARFRYALIDEFQDTDQVQWGIFRQLFFAPAGDGPHRLYLIGDPKQAIYGFRGADVHAYLAARREVLAAGGPVVPLFENFRSTPPLIASLNRILDQDAERPFFRGEIRYQPPAVAGRPGLRCLDPDGEALSPVHLLHVVGDGQTLSASVLRRALGRRIAGEIERWLDAPDPGFRMVDQIDQTDQTAAPARVRPSDIFVLTRTTKEGYELAECLRERGIPHAFYKQEGLFERPEAQALRDLLEAIDEPHRPERRLRAWMTPFFAVPLAELPACRDLPDSHPLVAPLLGWHALAEARQHQALFGRILEESGLVRRELLLKSSLRELTNVQHLCELLLEEGVRARASLKELIFTLRAFMEGRALPLGQTGDYLRQESDAEAVQIMTMHKAKGLEAAVVFLLGGFSTGASGPVQVGHSHGRRVALLGAVKDAPADLQADLGEEERRLLYVAMTRARGRLYLPYFGPAVPGEQMPVAARGERQHGYKSLNGPYRALNERLRDLLPGGAGVDAPLTVEEVLCRSRPEAEPGRLLAVTPVPAPAPASGPPGTPAFIPAAGLARRRQHAGFVVVSYTGLSRDRPGHVQDDSEPAWLVLDEPPSATPPEEPDDELPGGARTGIFLHEVIERLRFSSFGEAPGLEAWRTLPDVAALLGRTALRHGLEPRHLAPAAALIHASLTAPVALGEAGWLDGLHRPERYLREMPFLYPLRAGVGGAPPGAGSAAELNRERGFVTGVIDYLFEHQGKTYLCDWKSDRLPSYAPEALAAHVEAHYPLQAQLYVLAVARMLGLASAEDHARRFGGVLYCFLRGTSTAPTLAGQGMHFFRPGFADIEAFAATLPGLAEGRAP